MEDSSKNNFDKRGGELMPRELMERAADPALVPDEALAAILLKTCVHGLNVIELSRRLIEAFGSMKSLVSGDCVSRFRVPTMETVKRQVDILADLGYNHFRLIVPRGHLW